MNKSNRKIAVAIVALCAGLTGHALAAPNGSGGGNNTAKPGEFDASQFKLDMILARRGDPEAQYYVGNAYELGQGVHKDLKQAFAWYRKAAEQKQYNAQYKLGTFFEYGTGVKRDIRKAMEWYKRAAKNSRSKVVDHMNQQAFAHRKEEMKRALHAMNLKKLKRERARKLAQERKRQELALRQKQLAYARRKHATLAAAHKQKTVMQVNIPDIIRVALNHKWHSSLGSADYLPSSSTHCLRSSSDKIVCFSDQKQRIIKNQLVTYTTKATLTDFKPDGTFHVIYHFQVIHMAMSAQHGISADPNGLRLVMGWQKPPLQINCRTSDRINLYCGHGNTRLHYQH